MSRSNMKELIANNNLEEAIRDFTFPISNEDAEKMFVTLKEQYPQIMYSDCADWLCAFTILDMGEDCGAWLSGSGGCCCCLTCLLFAATGGSCANPVINCCCEDCHC